MTRVFALGDLHLSLAGHKPMHVFGELWRDHATRMATAWDVRVAAEDTVLVAGDISWARNLEEARPDLEWIAARPGRKILLRGNHDSWWSSQAKLRQALPECCEPLHNDSLHVGEWTVVGSRGWTDPDDPIAVSGEEKIYRRELHRLGLSIEHADRSDARARPRLALLHFPPRILGRAPGEVVGMLEQAGVQACVYGHLHGEDHRLAARGRHGAIDYHFVAADAVGFAPVLLPPPDRGDG